MHAPTHLSSTPVVTDISDHQIHATTPAPSAPPSSTPLVTEISDHQIQATTAAVATFTGAAIVHRAPEMLALAAGAAAAIMF